MTFQVDAVAAARSRLRIAQLDYREGKREAAKEVIETLAGSAPKAVALASAFSLGQFLAAEGKTDDARRALTALLQSGEPAVFAKRRRCQIQRRITSRCSASVWRSIDTRLGA